MFLLYSAITRLTDIAFRAQGKLFGKLSRAYDYKDRLRESLTTLLGSDRLVAVDVGGAVGLQPHWMRLRGSTKFVVFEPHPASFQELVQLYGQDEFASDFLVLPNALAGKTGERTLWLTNVPTGSTIVGFNEKSPFFSRDNSYLFPMKEQKVSAVSLEEALVTANVDTVDMVKLDVQGAELEILAGMGSNYLGQLLCIETEVPLQDIYLNATTLEDLLKFSSANDFEIFDLKTARSYLQNDGRADWHRLKFGVGDWSPSLSARAWEAEVVFFKSPKVLVAKKDKSKLKKLIGCYCVYNFYTEAMRLSEQCVQMGIFTADEGGKINREIMIMQRSLAKILAFYHKRAELFGNQNWTQYMWYTYPST